MKEVSKMSTDEIVARTRLLDNDIRIMKSEVVRISHEKQAQEDKIKENTEKIKVQFHFTLPPLSGPRPLASKLSKLPTK